MKKTIIAMALAGCFAISAAAQDNNTCPQAQNCPVAKTARSGKASDKMYRPQKFTDFAFEGILLDINQQARMDSLNAAMAPGQCADSACVNKACCAKDKARKCRRADRKEYVKKVKEILTPEQYTMFLENIVMMPEQGKAQMHSRRPDGPRGKEIKAVRDGKRQKDMKARVESRKSDKKDKK